MPSRYEIEPDLPLLIYSPDNDLFPLCAATERIIAATYNIYYFRFEEMPLPGLLLSNIFAYRLREADQLLMISILRWP